LDVYISLMLILLHILVHKFLHFTDGLNMRNNRNMINVLENGIFYVPHLYFQHLVVWVMLLLYFTRLAYPVSRVILWLSDIMVDQQRARSHQDCLFSLGALELALGGSCLLTMLIYLTCALLMEV